MKALIVDDSSTLRMFVRKMLKGQGFETIEAADGKEALERLAEAGGANVALVDWNMPVMNGYDFVCAVRALPEHNDMFIMMVTTESELDKVAQALEAGANEYLMKPFTKEDLENKLALLGVL